MKRWGRLFFTALILAAFGASCQRAGAPAQFIQAQITRTAEGAASERPPTPPSMTFQAVVESPSLTVIAMPADRAAAEDVAREIRAHQPGICGALEIACDFPVRVEIYPSQASFDEHVMNSELRGYYAISGKGTIQMVSPRVPPAQRMISYGERLLISVHEYAHLALNQANPDLPDWLAEGAAVYLGPHDLYDSVCQERFPFTHIPSLENLMNDYAEVPAADLFAYTLVRYIVEASSEEALTRLIRAPEDVSGVLGRSQADVEAQWLDFLEANCDPTP